MIDEGIAAASLLDRGCRETLFGAYIPVPHGAAAGINKVAATPRYTRDYTVLFILSNKGFSLFFGHLHFYNSGSFKTIVKLWCRNIIRTFPRKRFSRKLYFGEKIKISLHAILWVQSLPWTFYR